MQINDNPMIAQTLDPFWDALNAFEKRWQERLASQIVQNACDLLGEAKDLMLEGLAQGDEDMDVVRGALTNRLKGLLDDARFAHLNPTLDLCALEPEAILNRLTLPSLLTVSADVAVLDTQASDAVGDRFYKLCRRFCWQMRVLPRRVNNAIKKAQKKDSQALPPIVYRLQVAQICRAHMLTKDHFEPALVRQFEISVYAVQALGTLWQVVLNAAATDEEGLSERLEKICQESVGAIVSHGTRADQTVHECFETMRAELVGALCRVDAPWDVLSRKVMAQWQERRVQKRYEDLVADWARLFGGMLGSFDLELEIASFQFQTRAFAEQAREVVAEHLNTALYTPLDWMQKRCVADAEKIQDLFQRLVKDVDALAERDFAVAVDVLQKDIETLITQLATDYTVQVVQKVDRGRTVLAGRGEFAMFKEADSHLMVEVGGDCDFWLGDAPDWSLGMEPPDVETVRVPVQELIRPQVEGDVQRDLDGYLAEVSDLFTQTQQTLSEIWKVIRFNAESGIAEMEGDIADRVQVLGFSEEIIVGGLQRVGGRVAEVMDDVTRVRETVDLGIGQTLSESATQVAKNLRPDSELGVRLRRLKHMAQSRAEGYVELGEGMGAVLLRRWRRVWQWVGQTGKKWSADVRGLLGLAPVAQREAQETIDEADLANLAIDKLPPIYRRLFRLEPLLTDDFLIGRSEEMDIARDAVQRWAQGRPCALALVGEVGTGKTSLLNNMVPKLFHSCDVFRFAFGETVVSEEGLSKILCDMLGLKKTLSLNELAEHLQKRETPCVFILEHGYELFMRRIGGLEVIRGFLQLVLATSSQTFWCLSMTESAWRFLDAVVEISEYFPYVIETRNMPAQDLKEAVLVRHEVSGFGLHFLPGDSPSVARRLKKAMDDSSQQEILCDVFFDALSDASKGNVQIALFYWLRSIQEIRDDKVVVGPLASLRFAFLNALSADKLFTLAAMLQHGTLTVVEHATIFRTSETVSQGMLDTLAASNVVQIRPPTDNRVEARYTINPVMRRPIVDLLWNRHIFY